MGGGVMREHGDDPSRFVTRPEFTGRPQWSSVPAANGWSGNVYGTKQGPFVTIGIAVSKSSWGVNDRISTGFVPDGWRPVALFLNGGGNAAVDNAPRTWWIDPSTGDINAGAAGTGSIWGQIGYLPA